MTSLFGCDIRRHYTSTHLVDCRSFEHRGTISTVVEEGRSRLAKGEGPCEIGPTSEGCGAPNERKSRDPLLRYGIILCDICLRTTKKHRDSNDTKFADGEHKHNAFPKADSEG